jgi:hypothetical protein
MKINEFTNTPDTKLPFDLADDVVVFMRNDPVFYRKHYFPAMSSLADKFRAKKEINDTSIIGSIVDKGMNTYCKKYKLGRKPADIFTADDRTSLINRITSEELEEIKKGSY